MDIQLNEKKNKMTFLLTQIPDLGHKLIYKYKGHLHFSKSGP